MSRHPRSPTGPADHSGFPPLGSRGGCARPLPWRDLHIHRIVLAGIVATTELRGREQDAQHLGVAPGRPQREAIQSAGHQEAAEERVEQVERGGAEEERKEEEAAINAADRQWTMQRLVNRTIRRAIRHARTSEKPCEELRREERESTTEDDAGDLALGARLSVHKHESADDDRHQREGASQWSREGQREIVRGPLPWGLREGNAREK